MCSITWWHFQWPWRTRFSRSRHFWSRISPKRCMLGTKLLKNSNRKPYKIYWMIPLSMTLSDLWPHFKVTTFFEDKVLPMGTNPFSGGVKYTGRDRISPLPTENELESAVTKTKTKTYGMVLCLVTLTDLQSRRADLSASAELLV